MACTPYTNTPYGMAMVVSSTTRPTTAPDLALGRVIVEADTGRILFYDGTGWIILYEPAVTTFTPTWTQGAAITKTTNISRYQRQNGWIQGYYTLTASSGGTPASAIVGSLPIAGNANVAVFGQYQLFDASASQFFSGPMYVQSSTTFALQTNALVGAGLTTPTLAASDLFWVNFNYEMASPYS